MLTPEQLPLQATVSFDLYPSALLETGYKNAKVLGWISAKMASYLGVDPIAMHANVFPTLPVGTPNNYEGYPWIHLKLASGEETAIGLPWIKDETLVIATTRKMQFTIDSVTPAGQNVILAALSANGYSAVDVKYLT
jgi:hypothetical protein